MSKKIVEVNSAPHNGIGNFLPNIVLVIMLHNIITDRNYKIGDRDCYLFQENVKTSFQFTHGIIKGDTMQAINDIGASGQPGSKFCNKACLGFMGVNNIDFFLFYKAIIKNQCS